MKLKTRVFYWVLSIALILVGAILLYVDSVTLPSRYGADPVELLPPATWLVAGMPITFGIAITLYLKDAEKYKPICRAFVAAGLVMGFLGLVIVGPLMRG
jgi:hypothetical protein